MIKYYLDQIGEIEEIEEIEGRTVQIGNNLMMTIKHMILHRMYNRAISRSKEKITELKQR